MNWISPRRYFLDARRATVVEDGDPRAAFLLVAQGGTLPLETAVHWGLATRGQDLSTSSGSSTGAAPVEIEVGEVRPSVPPAAPRKKVSRRK